MFNKKTIAIFAILAVTLVAFSASYVVAKPGPGCAVRDSGCQAKDVTFNYLPNPPGPHYTLCVQGGHVYRFSATITCGIGFGDAVSGEVCAESTVPLSISLNGQTHTFAPAAGHLWQDVIDDCATYLTYSVN